jgi:putative MFS transporter
VARTADVDLTIIEQAPMTWFHRKLVLLCGGGPFLDGYALTIIGFAFIEMSPQLGLSSHEEGLVGTAALIGIFLGGFGFGYLTDRIGRQVMYVVNLTTLIAMSILSAFVTETWQLIATRLLLGIAIGADYPVATSLLSEFLPRNRRGSLLGTMITWWSAGAVAACLVGWALSGVGEDGWRYMLASAAIPAAVVVLFRAGTPESPRWLLSKGRVEEARDVVRQVYGVEMGEIAAPPDPPRTDFREIFRGGYLSRLIFTSVFWMCQLIPLFALDTFGPVIMQKFHADSEIATYVGPILINTAILVGCFPGMWLVDRAGRRPLLIWGFALTAIGLGLLTAGEGAPLWIIGLGSLIYALAAGAANILEWIYPNELFPTHVRATAMGTGTSLSRIGAAVSTYLLPVMLHHWGVGATMAFEAAVCIVGLIVAVIMAPETRHQTLAEAATVGAPAATGTLAVAPARGRGGR